MNFIAVKFLTFGFISTGLLVNNKDCYDVVTKGDGCAAREGCD